MGDTRDWIGGLTPWVSVGSKTAAGGGADSFVTNIIPADSVTLGLAVEGTGNFTTLSVTGAQSGTRYKIGNAVNSTGWVTVPINPALDTTYTVSWSSSGVGDTVAAFTCALAMGYPALGAHSASESIPVVQANDQGPAPWQAPGRLPVVVARVGIGNAALVPAVVGQTVYLFGVVMVVTVAVAASFAQITDTPGTLRGQWSAAAAGNIPFNFGGAPAGAPGSGANLAVAGGAATAICSLSYSQQ